MARQPKASDGKPDPSAVVGGSFSRPPGWPMHLAAIVAMIGMLHAFSVLGPGFFFFEGLGFIMLSVLMCLLWMARLALFIIGNSGRHRLRRSIETGWRGWIVGPLILLSTLSLIGFELPMRLRFSVSRNALSLLARQALAQGPKPLAPDWARYPVQRVGALNVTVMQVTPAGEVDFRVPGTEFGRSYSGFAYCPAGNPFDPEGSFEPLGGPWYVWYTSW